MHVLKCLSPPSPPAVPGDGQSTPKLASAVDTITSDYDSTPVPPTTTSEEEEGSSQEDDVMDVSTSSSVDELPDIHQLHPDLREGDSAVSKSGSKNTKDFLLSFFGKKCVKEDHAKVLGKASALTSFIPGKNTPRKIETRKVGSETFFHSLLLFHAKSESLSHETNEATCCLCCLINACYEIFANEKESPHFFHQVHIVLVCSV